MPVPTILPIQRDSTPLPLVGMDALRGWAAVAVVVLHACVPYTDPSMPGLDWSVRDTPSGSLTMLFWAIEVVIMPIFLVMAGFFAARSMARSGAMPTMKSRLKRWGMPFVLATIVLIPLELYIWLLGWVAEGHIGFRKLQSLKISADQGEHLWGLSHLWFLQYILTYVVVLACVWNRIVGISVTRLRTQVLPLMLIAAVGTLFMYPEVVWGFQHSFFPVLGKWTYSGLFFVAGAIWFRCDPELRSLSRQSDRLVGPSGLFLTASVVFGIWFLGQTTTGPLVRASLATVTVIAAAGWTCGVVGWCMKHVGTLGPITQRLSAASLMIYLVHHPVVGLAHISTKYAAADIPSWIKMVLVSLLGIGVGVGVDFLWGRHRARAQAVATNPTMQRLPLESSLGDPTRIDPVVGKPAKYRQPFRRAA